MSLTFLSFGAETPYLLGQGREPGETSAGARAPAGEETPSRLAAPPRPAQVGLTCTTSAAIRIRFPFPELGCLRRHLALSANRERSAPQASVIYLRARPMLPGASIHFRSSRRL